VRGIRFRSSGECVLEPWQSDLKAQQSDYERNYSPELSEVLGVMQMAWRRAAALAKKASGA
jgi:hypothetical protein